MNEIVKEVVETIVEIPKQLAPGAENDPGWTKYIKSQMRILGERHGYLVMPSEQQPQWLFDLIWFKNDSDGRLVELNLVLESEWLRDVWNIQEDFEKLLVAKADIKVMIFQNCGDNLPDLFDSLRSSISAFKKLSSEEVYVLAAFKEEQHEFEIQVVSAP